MRFSLMGPVRVEGAEGVLDIRGNLRRTLLAVLLLHADTVVSSDRLVEHLWGEDSPASPAAPLYNQVMRLRQSLGEAGERIKAAPPGYLIHVEPGELDLQIFAQRREAGRRFLASGAWAAAEAEFAAALDLWRGEPLADLPSLAGHPIVQRLAEDRLQVTGGLIEARLNLGRHDEMIEELVMLAARHPLHQSFHAQLILALYRAGQRSAALDAYRALEKTLVDELGIEPSAELQDLHDRILNSSETLLGATSPATATTAGPRRQLPADTRLFTGRVHEVSELVDLAASASAGTVAGATVLSALNGMGGVGKSALAIHAAHRVSESFPDGQLFVDLRGHTAGMEPLLPLDALHQLLRSLDVPHQAIPEDLAECSALYRSTLAGTKTLIVLDDAAGADQVRPLLPDEPGCFVLITSRAILTGLNDARSIGLDLLPEDDSVALLRKVAGPNRVPADHPALTELVDLCGRIPLGIRIAGARLRHNRDLRVEDLVAQLRSDGERLEHLRDDDRNLTALFDASYDDLDEAEQRLFRLLGLVPGLDTDVYAAANLIGSDLRTVERLLDTLLEHNLLREHERGRYRLHDLLRVYARARADGDSAGDTDAALTRLLDYYRHAALAADRHITSRTRIHLTASVVGAVPEQSPEFSDEDHASSWLAAELSNIRAAIALEGIAPAHLIALTTALATFLYRRGPWPLATDLHQRAISVARETGDGLSEGEALIQLCQVQQASGQIHPAIETCERALAVFRALGDLRGTALALDYAADIRISSGEFDLAMEMGEQALVAYRELGDKRGMADTLWSLGRVKQRLVNTDVGAEHLKEALALYVEIGNAAGEAVINFELARMAFNLGRYAEAAERASGAVRVFHEKGFRQNECAGALDLGHILFALGEFAEATELVDRGLRLAREIGFRFGEASSSSTRGKILMATGDHRAAADASATALEIYRELGDQYGEALMLHDLGQSKHALGELVAANELLSAALDVFQEMGNVEMHASTLIRLGALEADTSGVQVAIERHREAMEMVGDGSYPPVMADALAGIARLLAPTDRPAALTELRKAVELYREMGAWQKDQASAYLAELEAVS